MKQIFKIKTAFMVPFIIAVVLLFVLLGLTPLSDWTWEKILLTTLSVIALAVAIEASEREIVVSENEFNIKKFFRSKSVTWAEITHLGVVVMNNKAYFLLTTTRGLFMFSNLLQDHTLLLQYLIVKLENEKVENEIKTYLEHPVERTSLIIITWVILIFIAAIIATKYL